MQLLNRVDDAETFMQIFKFISLYFKLRQFFCHNNVADKDQRFKNDRNIG